MLKMMKIMLVLGTFYGAGWGYAAAQNLTADDLQNLSVEQAIELALSTNPEILSFAKNIDLAREDIDFAQGGYRPNVTATGTINHLQTNNDVSSKWQSGTEKSASLSVEQPLYTGGQTAADIRQNESRLNATRYQFDSLVHDTIIQIVTVYMATYTADEARRVNADNVNLLQEQLNATSARFEAGELTKTDVAQAEARLAAANAEKAESEAIYEVALSSFREVTGIKGDIDLFYPNIDMSDLPATLAEAMAIGLENNPDIQAAMANLDASGYHVTEQERALYPQLDLNAGLNFVRDPAFSQFDRQETANVGVTATMPLYQSGRLRNQIRQSKIQKAQAKDNLETARRSVTDDVIAAWEEYKAIQVQITAREAQLNAATIAYEGVRLEEQVGSRSILDVLDANQEVRDAELALIQIKGDVIDAYYALLGAMGRLAHSL